MGGRHRLRVTWTAAGSYSTARNIERGLMLSCAGVSSHYLPGRRAEQYVLSTLTSVNRFTTLFLVVT